MIYYFFKFYYLYYFISYCYSKLQFYSFKDKSTVFMKIQNYNSQVYV